MNEARGAVSRKVRCERGGIRETFKETTWTKDLHDDLARAGEAELRLARLPRRLEAHDQAHGEPCAKACVRLHCAGDTKREVRCRGASARLTSRALAPPVAGIPRVYLALGDKRGARCRSLPRMSGRACLLSPSFSATVYPKRQGQPEAYLGSRVEGQSQDPEGLIFKDMLLLLQISHPWKKQTSVEKCVSFGEEEATQKAPLLRSLACADLSCRAVSLSSCCVLLFRVKQCPRKVGQLHVLNRDTGRDR